MKTIQLFFFLSILLCSNIFAQSPALINYQAVVRDGNGALITSGTVQLGIELYDSVSAGNMLYMETHTTTPNQFGLVNVQIGGGAVLNGNFLMINWASGNKFMQMHVNGLPMGARVQWVSVPFALNAANGNPVGTVLPYCGTVANIPAGWLLCDGAVVSSTQYAGLYAVIQNQFGNGVGPQTFHLPDFRGRFLRGVDGGTGRDPDAGARTSMNAGGLAGNNVGSVQSDAFQGHIPSGGITQSYVAPGALSVAATTYSGTSQPLSGHIGGLSLSGDGINGTPRISSETRPQNANVLYIIKY